jgi:hypothetical protein
MTNSEPERVVEDRQARARKLDGIGWGLFFIWAGIALLANIGWGLGLLGIGIIALGVQAARRYFDLPIDQFGLVTGILFVVAGLWELLNLGLGEAAIPGGFIPILSIALGVVLVVSAWLRKR